MKKLLTLLAAALLTGPPAGASAPSPAEALLKTRDPFYKQHVVADGLLVVGSEKVSKYALGEVAHLIRKMLANRPDLRKNLVKRNVYVGVMAYNEMTTDMPECRGMSPWWDKRARGLGGNPVICAEENVLSFRGDPWQGESIFIHEFAHAVHGGLVRLDKQFDARLRGLHQKAKETGRFRGYGMGAFGEFWAEGVQSWFNCNRRGGLEALGPKGRPISHINTREELKRHLPALAKLIDDAFRQNRWVYVPVAKRLHQPHLRGYDPTKAPTFRWPKKVIEAYKRIEAEKAKKRKQQKERATKKQPRESADRKDSAATAGSSAAEEIRMAPDSMTMAAVPADGRIAITDYGYRDWGPQLAHYRLDTAKFRPGKLVLLDEAGRAVPFQIDDGVLAFVAAAAKGKTTTYTLKASPTDRSAENSTLKAAEKGEYFEMTNGLLSLRMPQPGRKAYSPASEASGVPAPIAAWAGSDPSRASGPNGGKWMGSARFATPRKIRSHTFRVLRRGPAVVEYEGRYNFAPKGRYVWRVRLSPGMPIAVVTEEFDVGEVTRGEDMVLLDLHKGWRPRNVATSGGQGEQQLPKLTGEPLGAFVQRQKKSRGTRPPVGGVGDPPGAVVPAEGMVLLARIVPGGKWGGYKGSVQLYDGDRPGSARAKPGSAAAKPGMGRNIAFVPLSTGSWRRAMAVNVWHQADRGVVLSLPISVRHMRWSLDIADDFSPFSTHEHDPHLPATFGRRVWGLYVGTDAHLAQARFGYIGLDRYKDWIIEVPDTAGAKAYPGGFFSPRHVARIRKALDKHPDREFLRRWYLVGGRTEDAVAHAKMVIKRLAKPYGQNDFFLVGLSNYRKSQFLAFVNRAEDALACPKLPADLRAELRRRLALYAYVTSDPDFNPRGSGIHLGNNNMTINRTLALTYFACLLPDHPRYAYWISRAAAYARFKLATQTAPSGAWVACPSYQTYSPLRTLNITQIACRNRGVADFAETGRHAATLMYLANLTMADPRYGGRRIIPGMGNSSNLLENVWGFCMAAVADSDPRLAARFRYFNRLANRDVPMAKGPNHHDDTTAHPMYYLPDIPEDRTPLGTTFMPVYGVVFRNHFGHRNETAMLFRAGMGWSHWDSDYLNVILYGRGAPLSPGTGYQYYSGPATKNNAVYHNQVKVGRRDLPEVFGRVDGGVIDYGFGPHADYAVAERFYPSQLFRDGRGAMLWRRHVMFLKSPSPDGPSYFVMRDTFPGGEARKKWWTWLNLGPADRIKVDGKAFDAAATPVDKVVPVKQMPALRGRILEMDSGHGASTWIWFDRPVVARARLTFQAARETKTIVEVDAAGGEDFFYVVVPLGKRKRGQASFPGSAGPKGASQKRSLSPFPPPRCEKLADGTLRIRTAEATDVVFLADEPLNYDAGGIVFTGKAGAVRAVRDRVALCMNAGSGKIGYRGHVLHGHGPFERTVKLADLKGGTHEVPGGYEKKIATVDLGRGVKVTGEGPFEAVLDGDVIRIKTRGRRRVLRVTQPPFITRPQYFIDLVEWMACWTDYPASGWGAYDNTWQIGLSVPAGVHELLVRNMVFPEGWTRPFTPAIRSAVRK